MVCGINLDFSGITKAIDAATGAIVDLATSGAKGIADALGSISGTIADSLGSVLSEFTDIIPDLDLPDFPNLQSLMNDLIGALGTSAFDTILADIRDKFGSLPGFDIDEIVNLIKLPGFDLSCIDICDLIPNVDLVDGGFVTKGVQAFQATADPIFESIKDSIPNVSDFVPEALPNPAEFFMEIGAGPEMI